MIRAPKANLLGLGIGLTAAGAGAALGLVAERLAVGRPVIGRIPKSRASEFVLEGDLGTLRSVPVTVLADDGVELYAEIDEADPQIEQLADDDVTLVFCHGYCLNLDSWHFQRKAFRGKVRMVFWDHRGHGRSQRGDKGSATVRQLGADLERVIGATVPSGRLVLVGHSMGGMTVMSLAARNPALFTSRVVAAALVATSSGDLAAHDLGLDRLGQLVMKVAPSAIELVARRPGWVERGRRIGSDLEEVIVKRWSYASPVSQELLDFTARMIASTRIEVVSEFLPQLTKQDGTEALGALSFIPVLILAGDKDLMIPPEHSEQMAQLLPEAQLVIVEKANHLVMLERPDILNQHLTELLGSIPASARSRRSRR